MFYQPGVRIHRPKVYKVKQGFQVALLVVFCIWVLYQIKHSYDKKKDYGGTLENIHGSKHTATGLGRKPYFQTTDMDEAKDFLIADKDSNRSSEEKENEKRISDKQTLDESEVSSSSKEENPKVNYEPVRGISTFPDENGVPQDSKEFLKFSPNEVHSDENIITVNHQVQSLSYAESQKQATGEGLEQAIANSEGFNSSDAQTSENRLASGDIVDNSGFKATSETKRGNVKSLAIQHDNTGMTDLNLVAKKRNGARAKDRFDAEARIKGV